MEKIYKTEKEGQIDFFNNYGIPWQENNGVLVENCDGVYNGVLFEFKLNINDLNKTLFQAIKYLSRMRVHGESVPATILLVSLNNKTAYEYKSQDYFDEIHKIYTGAASKNNDGFCAKTKPEVFEYSEMLASSKLKKIVKNVKTVEEMYMPVEIDENCVVGWAERYYREIQNASKGDFIGDNTENGMVTGEIREPRHFKGLILPYNHKTNERFKKLMDCLNDRLSKKDLGAFYTPEEYANKAAELVIMAVERAISAGKKDYVILDRCAGTGSLEAAMIGLKDSRGDELISHCVVSTYEYYEYKVLNERVGDKVRDIVPSTEGDIVFGNGKILNADAMTKEYIENEVIKQYIEDEDCAVILFENPPYHDESSGMDKGVVERSGKKMSYVLSEMKKEVKGVATNEIANQFIWSAFKYYLRQNSDSYIVFSPIKYWKQYNFINAKPTAAYAFNREYFHASASTVLCVLWENISNAEKFIDADFYDIKNNALTFVKKEKINKVSAPASKNYTKMAFKEDDKCDVYCAKDGTEAVGKKIRVKGYHTSDVIGYLEADSFQIAPHVRNITATCLYNGNGCYLTSDNYETILPIWVAKHIPLNNWYEKDIYATTSDGGDTYTKDDDFLKACLLYTVLSNQNKCLSFLGSDGHMYQNELCLDNSKYERTKEDAKKEGKEITSGSKEETEMLELLPVAYRDLMEYEELDDDEKELVSLWKKILEEARAAEGYDSELNYGVYQITKELNTFKEEKQGKGKKKVYVYPLLNGDLNTLRTKLKEYYVSHIKDKMFKYQLIK